MATAGNTLEGVRDYRYFPGVVFTRLLQKWAKAFPMGRFGVPEDVAAVASFFASKEASFITGQTVRG